MSPTARQKLEALAGRFRADLPRRIGDIAQALARLRQGEGDWQTFHRCLHSLVGAAGTFGLGNVSDGARALERLVKPVAREGAAPDWAAMEAALGRLRSLVDGEAPPASPARTQAGAPSLPPLASPAHVLVAEDDRSTRELLAAQLRRAGHRVQAVENGLAALEYLAVEEVDLVLMDVSMPVLDGLAAVQRLREEEGRLERPHVPVIFLTADEDPQLLHRAIRAGGDDLLFKPCSTVVLDAKIHALQRLSRLNRELARYRRETDRELAVAERVMSAALARNDPDFPGLCWKSRSAGRFSGDGVFFRRTGQLGYLLVVDFTGHGLPAAVGNLIAGDLFHELAEIAQPGEVLLAGLNDKLYTHLPADVFCAACLVQVDVEARQAKVWNRGLPDALWREADGALRRLPSAFLPLGILPGRQYDTRPQVLAAGPNNRLFVHSDGLNEARAADGRQFGLQVVEQLAGEDEAVARILAALDVHLGGRLPEDDVTLAQLDLAPWLPARSAAV